MVYVQLNAGLHPTLVYRQKKQKSLWSSFSGKAKAQRSSLLHALILRDFIGPFPNTLLITALPKQAFPRMILLWLNQH